MGMSLSLVSTGLLRKVWYSDRPKTVPPTGEYDAYRLKGLIFFLRYRNDRFNSP